MLSGSSTYRIPEELCSLRIRQDPQLLWCTRKVITSFEKFLQSIQIAIIAKTDNNCWLYTSTPDIMRYLVFELKIRQIYLIIFLKER